MTGVAFVGGAGATESGEHIELAFGEIELAVHGDESLGQFEGDAVQPADDALGRRIDVGAFATPLLLDVVDPVGREVVHGVWLRHPFMVPLPVVFVFLVRYYLFRGR